MRGDRGPPSTRDRRHNKDANNLKSSLKKGTKSKKNRVVFDESANEFFEADYIIVVRDECSYSDGDECGGCGSCEKYSADGENGALSPPEGYKDLGLFNSDGTLREQAWWEAGPVLLVGERSGTVFTPHHLQLLRRLQRERMLRATICADCDAHAALHQPIDMEYGYDDEEVCETDYGRETSGRDSSVRENSVREASVREAPVREVPGREAPGREAPKALRRTAKHIAAGEERPKINSSQQTTPTDECPSELSKDDSEFSSSQQDASRENSIPNTSDESDTPEGNNSSESSPTRSRRAGILKGGRLWKSSLDVEKETNDQCADQRSTTASDDDSNTTRSVRFLDRPRNPEELNSNFIRQESNHRQSNQQNKYDVAVAQNPTTKTNSAVRQLFNSGKAQPQVIEPQLTAESLRAWDSERRPRSEDFAIKRPADRNVLRCSLLRSEAKKRQPPKVQQDTTSLAERIRKLTCDLDDEIEEDRSSPAGASGSASEKSFTTLEKTENIADKFYSTTNSLQHKYYSNDNTYGTSDKYNSMAYNISSSTVSSAPRQPMQMLGPTPDLAGDIHPAPPKTKQESRRQFLSTLAPLTACVGGTGSNEGFYCPAAAVPAAPDRGDGAQRDDHVPDAPAPDVVAGTPGAMDEDGLAAFARAATSRTERLRKRYSQDALPTSDDDEHDDYGFQRRPAVRGISIKQDSSNNDILQAMQSQMTPAVPSNQVNTNSSQATNNSVNPCAKTSNYSWAYYSESNLTQNTRQHKPVSNILSWSGQDRSKPEHSRASNSSSVQHLDSCYLHNQNAIYGHAYPQRPLDALYQNCASYGNFRCGEGVSAGREQEGCSATSSEQTSPVAARRRRPESPPPIRTYHQLLYIPHAYVDQHDNDYPQPPHYATDYQQHASQQYYQQSSSGASTPQQMVNPNRMSQPHNLPLQVQVDRHGGSGGGGGTPVPHALCPATMRYRTLGSSNPAGGKHMICYSEKVQGAIYQVAGGSPAGSVRGAPEGAPAPPNATQGPTSPLTPAGPHNPHNPLYYAMNV